MRKRLERNTDKALIAGVIAGLADYFDQDTTLLRLAAVVLIVLTGFFPGVFLYIVAWIIMPVKNSAEPVDVEYEVVDS